MATFNLPFYLVMVLPLCHFEIRPSLNYHLLSLGAVTEKDHTYTLNYEEVTVFFSTRDTLFSPYVKRLNVLCISTRHAR